jgi:hypothetical protein
MGPILICDKSTLQGLGRRELNVLRKYYLLNVPPVLLAEILADLKKHDNASMSEDEVSRLANKLVPACSKVNVNYRDLIQGELAGCVIPMNCRAVVAGANRVIGEDGKKGAVFEHSAEADALLRWQTGSFKEAEAILADVWRRATQSLDLEGMQRKLRPAYSAKMKLHTLAETAQFVDDLMASASPELLVSWILRDIGLSMADAESFIGRLHNSPNQSFQSLVPYTAHCVRVGLIFHFALVFGLIGTRSTNRIDMEYLYYAPFCHAFSSGDVSISRQPS